LKEVVNEALRLGLGLQEKGPRQLPYEVKPHHCGAFRAAVDPLRLNQLYDELEVGAAARTTLHERGPRKP
ncbi:MAG TPA: hypothetical protein VGQ83_42480, partial [Polyangia bacterium]